MPQESYQIDQFPHLAEYFWYNKDPSGSWLEHPAIYPSGKDQLHRDAAHILKILQQRNGNDGYRMNRLRERVSLLVFAGLMNPKSVELTSVVNDIICGVDAIAVFNSVEKGTNEVCIAINFTEDFSRIQEKVKRTQWSSAIEVRTGHNSAKPEYMYFMVVAVAKALVVRVLNSLEEIVQKYPKIAADTLIQRTNYIVQDMAKKDLYPDHLFQLHAPVGSPIGSLITFPDII